MLIAPDQYFVITGSRCNQFIKFKNSFTFNLSILSLSLGNDKKQNKQHFEEGWNLIVLAWNQLVVPWN